jgi:hypothetical protein
MIRIILAFVIVFGLFFFGIRYLRNMSGKETWSLVKLLTYSAVCAILTFGSLIALVVLF